MATTVDKLATDLRDALGRFWDAHQDALALSSEFSARGLSGIIADGDFADENYDITAQVFSDALGTVAAVETLMGQGHRTNVCKMIKR